MTFEGKEMRWYSVWELQEMEAEELFLKFDVEPPPPTALLLCVSEAAAAAVQLELFKLCEKCSQSTNTGEEAHTVDTGTLGVNLNVLLVGAILREKELQWRKSLIPL